MGRYGTGLLTTVGCLSVMALAMTGCSSTPKVAYPAEPPVALNQKLKDFARLHNQRNFDALMPYFASGAVVQSPSMPRSGNGDQYIKRMLDEPFSLEVVQTDLVYSTPTTALTRGTAKVFSPGKYSMTERIDVNWVVENGDWKIRSLEYTDWSPLLGSWKKANLRGEPSIELRLMPGGNYLVFAANDRVNPTFRGKYAIEGNHITMADTGADDPRSLQTGEGVYVINRSGQTAFFRKLSDANTWRSERFEGDWASHR